MYIEKRHIINSRNLSGANYLDSILLEAGKCGLLSSSEIEKIQFQCLNLLAYSSERYTMGDSSSIKIETAESILRSIFYTIGIYLKTFSNPDDAVNELKAADIAKIYAQGRRIIYKKLEAAKSIYDIVLKNKIKTTNLAYNSTLLGAVKGFFKTYDVEFKAHEVTALIDYPLCNAPDDVAGVEYVQQYLENLLLENELCGCFEPDAIHNLMYIYDAKYNELLVNIFEHVLTAALGCALINRGIRELTITSDDVRLLNEMLQKQDNAALLSTLNNAVEHIFKVLNLQNPLLRAYTGGCLPKIAANIRNALKLNTLDKVFITAKDAYSESKIYYKTKAKMDDAKYRKLLAELAEYDDFAEKIRFIKENIQSFDDLEDIIFDAGFNETEIKLLLGTLEDGEIAILIKRHPFVSDMQADLSETERKFRLCLASFVKKMPKERQAQIIGIAARLVGS